MRDEGAEQLEGREEYKQEQGGPPTPTVQIYIWLAWKTKRCEDVIFIHGYQGLMKLKLNFVFMPYRQTTQQLPLSGCETILSLFI